MHKPYCRARDRIRSEQDHVPQLSETLAPIQHRFSNHDLSSQQTQVYVMITNVLVSVKFYKQTMLLLNIIATLVLQC